MSQRKTEEGVRIKFESGGGVTGPAGNRSCRLDSDNLPDDEAATLCSLVTGANLPALAGQAAGKSLRPDETYYELTVEDGDKTHVISASDRSMPDALRPLVRWLTAKAVTSAL